MLTEKEIEEGNELIDRFIGGKSLETEIHYPYGSQPLDFDYHRSWDWLMPVCKKIHELYFDKREEMYSGLTNCDINQTYIGVVEFLKFWNNPNEAKYIWSTSPKEAIDFIKKQGCKIQ